MHKAKDLNLQIASLIKKRAGKIKLKDRKKESMLKGLDSIDGTPMKIQTETMELLKASELAKKKKDKVKKGSGLKGQGEDVSPPPANLLDIVVDIKPNTR